MTIIVIHDVIVCLTHDVIDVIVCLFNCLSTEKKFSTPAFTGIYQHTKHIIPCEQTNLQDTWRHLLRYSKSGKDLF